MGGEEQRGGERTPRSARTRSEVRAAADEGTRRRLGDSAARGARPPTIGRKEADEIVPEEASAGSRFRRGRSRRARGRRRRWPPTVPPLLALLHPAPPAPTRRRPRPLPSCSDRARTSPSFPTGASFPIASRVSSTVRICAAPSSPLALGSGRKVRPAACTAPSTWRRMSIFFAPAIAKTSLSVNTSTVSARGRGAKSASSHAAARGARGCSARRRAARDVQIAREPVRRAARDRGGQPRLETRRSTATCGDKTSWCK